MLNEKEIFALSMKVARTISIRLITSFSLSFPLKQPGL